jgi:signal transduction histidine kinase
MATSTYQNRLALYQRLIEISRDLVSTLDLNELLLRIVDAAVDLCQAEAASILLYDEAKRELHFEVATNIENPASRGLIVPVDSSIAGWVVTNRQPVIINDAQRDQRHFHQVGEVLQMSIHSLMAVPLITKNKVIGAVEAINKCQGQFSDADLDLLSALGAQAAIAIENSRLFQQSDLIAELVHELRTPMASLNTAVHLLLRPDVVNEQRVYITNMIRSEISRLSELTTSFLDLAQLESGRMQFNPEPFDLNQLLDECTEMMRARSLERSLSLERDTDIALPKLIADPNKIKQVIINLLSNAIKYNKLGGKITIKSFQNGEYLSFSIADTGPGISTEDMQHLFEKFYRVPGSEKLASGTGLGLSICKKIIDAHQGKIEVESSVGQGTRFIVSLPLHL